MRTKVRKIYQNGDNGKCEINNRHVLQPSHFNEGLVYVGTVREFLSTSSQWRYHMQEVLSVSGC